MSFPKVRRRRSPLPHHPPPHPGLCSSHLDIQPGVVRAGLDQHDLAREGVRGAGSERGSWENVCAKMTLEQNSKELEDTSHLG